MEIKGKIISLLPLVQGEGKNGTWKKQEFILETEGKFPKKVCMSLWGDNIDKNKLVIGSEATVSFDVESKEFNSKWYTECRGWKVDYAGGKSSSSEDMPTSFSTDNTFNPQEDIMPF